MEKEGLAMRHTEYLPAATPGTVPALHSHPLVLSLPGHRHWVLSIAWSPDGKKLASGCKNSQVHLGSLSMGLGGIRGVSGFFRGVRGVSHCLEQDSHSPKKLCVWMCDSIVRSLSVPGSVLALLPWGALAAESCCLSCGRRFSLCPGTSPGFGCGHWQVAPSRRRCLE